MISISSCIKFLRVEPRQRRVYIPRAPPAGTGIPLQESPPPVYQPPPPAYQRRAADDGFSPQAMGGREENYKSRYEEQQHGLGSQPITLPHPSDRRALSGSL